MRALRMNQNKVAKSNKSLMILSHSEKVGESEHLQDVKPTLYHYQTWLKCKPISTYRTVKILYFNPDTRRGRGHVFFSWHIMKSTCKRVKHLLHVFRPAPAQESMKQAELRARLETCGADLEDGWYVLNKVVQFPPGPLFGDLWRPQCWGSGGGGDLT